jgi:hypothetical protein
MRALTAKTTTVQLPPRSAVTCAVAAADVCRACARQNARSAPPTWSTCPMEGRAFAEPCFARRKKFRLTKHGKKFVSCFPAWLSRRVRRCAVTRTLRAADRRLFSGGARVPRHPIRVPEPRSCAVPGADGHSYRTHERTFQPERPCALAYAFRLERAGPRRRPQHIVTVPRPGRSGLRHKSQGGPPRSGHSFSAPVSPRSPGLKIAPNGGFSR